MLKGGLATVKRKCAWLINGIFWNCL